MVEVNWDRRHLNQIKLLCHVLFTNYILQIGHRVIAILTGFLFKIILRQ